MGSIESRSSVLARYMRREVVVGSQFSVEHKDPPVGDRVFALWAVSGGVGGWLLSLDKN